MARKFNRGTAFGRVFDPLTDKVMLNGEFVFLIGVPGAGLTAWMVALIVGRETFVTGVRGYVESLGMKFGADWFGKLKTVLQCVYLGAALAALSVRGESWAGAWVDGVVLGLAWAMLAATAGSGVQYCAKAVRMLRSEVA